jgi:hypothetical protein
MSDDEKTPEAADQDEDLSAEDLEYVSQELAEETTDIVIGGGGLGEAAFGEPLLGEAGLGEAV